jgi:serine/threonine protein kinase
MGNDLEHSLEFPLLPATIDELLQQLVDQANAGSTIDVDAICQAHPQWNRELRDMLPVLLLLENSRKGIIPADPARLDGEQCRRMGNYELGRAIGRGGMGVVYEATQSPLGRRVAIKLLREVEATPVSRQRFQQEFRIAASLHHTNIVPVFDAGEDNGQLYFAMQLIDGVPVSQWRSFSAPTFSSTVAAIDQSTVSAKIARDTESQRFNEKSDAGTEPVRYAGSNHRQLAEIGIQIASALHFAHLRGIIHRDIKPSNVLVDGNANAWITDFGLAKLVDAKNLTDSGDVAGTIRYLAPERLKGKCDCRSDVYSLGLVMMEMLTGRPAWDDVNGAALVSKLTNGEAYPFPETVDVPSDLRLIIEKAIQPHPELRFQSAQELADDLTRFCDARPISARRFSRLRCALLWARRNPTVAVLGSSTFLALFAGILTSTIFAINWHEAATTSRRREQEAIQERDRASDSLELTQRALAEMTSGTMTRYLASRQALTVEDREFLNNVLKYHRQLGELAPKGEWARAVYAHGLQEVSKVRQLLGQIIEAESDMRESIAIFENLANEFPETPEYRMEAASAQLPLGRYLAENRKFEEALVCFESARDELGVLPPIPEFQSRIDRDYATSLNNVANIKTAFEEYAFAVGEYKRAIEIQRRQADREPGDISCQVDLSRSLHNLANCLTKAGQTEAAIQPATEAIELRRSVAQKTDEPAHWKAVEGSLVVLGRLQKALGQNENAIVSFREAEAVVSKLSTEFPGVPGYRNSLASSMSELASFLKDLGRNDEAIVLYERLIPLRVRLTEEIPDQVTYFGWLAEAQDALAQLMLESDPNKGLALFQASLASYDEVLQRAPQLWAIESRNNVVVRMAHCYWKKMNDSEAAEALYRQAEVTWKTLADENPENTRFRVWQSGVARFIGEILLEHDQRTEGMAKLREALATAESITNEQESYETALENIAAINDAIAKGNQVQHSK